MRRKSSWKFAARTFLFVAAASLAVSTAWIPPSDAQIVHKKKKPKQEEAAPTTAEPDKVLYERALRDIKKGRHEVGRLNLQTLINTYPDSEYLAKAKLSIADSYYRESGSSNMTQAIAGYKDFIVFFPFLEQAPYAQHQVAMGHYRQMEKPDRDRSQAKEAEAEFQIFLQKYPTDPLRASAEQHLREVQEVLAEGDYRIGRFYYLRGDRRAAAARLISVTRRYPLYSRSDKALWMLGDIFEKSERKDIAAGYYSRIVRNYPLSPLAGDAKSRLVASKVPVPQPDPHALAWMQAEQNAPRTRQSFLRRPMSLVQSGPKGELRAAATTGTPNLEPEADTFSATDILSGGGKTSLGSSGPGNAAVIETVTPGGAAPAASSDTTGGAAATDPSQPAAEGTTENPPADPATVAPAEPAAQPTDAPAAKGSDAQAPAPDTDKKDVKESTSKKKKGIKKIIPF